MRTRMILSSFYLTNFAVMGVFMPYFSVHARDLGFTATRIGLLMAVAPLTKAVLPLAWGAAADRWGHRRGLLVLASWSATIAFTGYLAAESFLACLLLMCLYSALAVPVLPFVEATTLETLEASGGDYGRIRLFGSLGFALSAFLFGQAMSGDSPFPVISTLLVLMLLNSIAASLVAGVPGSASLPPARRKRSALDRPMWLALATGFFMQASHGPYYAFFSLELRDAGYTPKVIGAAWAGAILCEIILLASAGVLLSRVSLRRLMAVSVTIATLRWLLYAFSLAPPALFVGQAMHAFTYAGFHVAAIRLLFRLSPAGTRSTGMTLYSGWTYGAGLMAGTAASGLIHDAFGPRSMFLFGALLAASSLVIIALGAGRVGDGGPDETAPDPGPGFPR